MQKDTLYLQELNSNSEKYQRLIDDLLEKYQTQPVHYDYSEIILSLDDSLKFLEELTYINIAVEMVSLWCHVTPENEKLYGCPHGHGGPRDRFGEGWFSEWCELDFYVKDYGINFDNENILPEFLVKQSNNIVKKYLEHDLPKHEYYLPCTYPSLWLYVPKKWKRIYYLV